MAKIRSVIAKGSGIFHYEVEKHKDIAEALTRFYQAKVDVVVILGGQALTSATFEHIVEKDMLGAGKIPLAILPAGDNNIVAESLGSIRSEPHKALQDLLHKHANGTLMDKIFEYPLIKIEGVRGVDYLYGLFFCAGEIVKQKELFHRKISGSGLFYHLFNWLFLAKLINKAYRRALGKNRLEDAIRINRNQRGAVVGHFCMVMITTLEKSFLGVILKKTSKKQMAHFVSVENTTEAVLQTGKQIFHKNYDRTDLAGHVVTEIQHARIILPSPFVLDGSYYEANNSGELFLTVTDHLKFIGLS